MSNRIKLGWFFLTMLVILHSPAFAQEQDEPTTASMEVAIYKPVKKKASNENVSKLKAPKGFEVAKFAEDLGNARMLAVGDNGAVYVTAQKEGKVVMLRDTNSDGKADQKETVAEGIKDVHGIAIHNHQMYLATVKEILRADINSDGSLGEPEILVDDLPDGGQHPNRTIAFGPDGKMYVSVGSTCNACEETNPEHATILRLNPDGTEREVFARGLRNTVGFNFHPTTDELWGMDHNTDWLGDNEDHEELNKIEEGAHYGWPYVYDEGKKMPHREPEGEDFEEFVKKTEFPKLMYQPHSAPMAMAFVRGDQFPEEYQQDAFVAMRGSWNRENPTGYKVVRIRYEDNEPQAFEDFLTGFLLEDGKSHFGRLAGLTFHTDGSLLVSDDSNGVIYRVSYNGN